MPQVDIDKIVQEIVSEIMAGKKNGPDALAPDTNTYDVKINARDIVKHVAVGCDHTALDQKNIIKTYLTTLGYRVADVGTFTEQSVDYPDYAAAVAKKVSSGECERGIMLDGAGIGSCMACNKVRGIRAALCYDLRTVINSREHNNANVLTLGGPFHSGGELCEMAKVWIETRFPGGRHWVRINKLMALEREGNLNEPG